MFGRTTLGINNNIMFPLSVSMSTLSGIKSVVDYLHNGPMKITYDTKCDKIFALLCMVIYISLSFGMKIMIFTTITFLAGVASLLLQVHGFWIFLIVFLLFVAFPAPFIAGPLIRVFGFRK